MQFSGKYPADVPSLYCQCCHFIFISFLLFHFLFLWQISCRHSQVYIANVAISFFIANVADSCQKNTHVYRIFQGRIQSIKFCIILDPKNIFNSWEEVLQKFPIKCKFFHQKPSSLTGLTTHHFRNPQFFSHIHYYKPSYFSLYEPLYFSLL